MSPKLQSTFAKEQIIRALAAGRAAGLSEAAQSQRAENLSRRAIARRDWDPASLPAWLTEQVFTEQIQPRLSKLRPADMRDALGVTRYFARSIQRGDARAHPRHWVKLAELVGYLPGR